MKTPPAMAAPHFPFPSGAIEDDALVAAKVAARRRAAARRTNSDPALGALLSEHVLNSIPFPPHAIVAGFWPMGDEIDIRPLLHALHARGHRIALPVTGRRGEPLVFRAWQPDTPLMPGRFGTSHPTGSTVTPDVLLMPLLAFDRRGNRLGYGGGFYDRTVALLPQAMRIGCAFAAQELDSVPSGPYDQRLHAVVTETGVRQFPTAGATGP
jgi:5-formyltetrahydrofolate cyclo-ligase